MEPRQVQEGSDINNPIFISSPGAFHRITCQKGTLLNEPILVSSGEEEDEGGELYSPLDISLNNSPKEKEAGLFSPLDISLNNSPRDKDNQEEADLFLPSLGDYTWECFSAEKHKNEEENTYFDRNASDHNPSFQKRSISPALVNVSKETTPLRERNTSVKRRKSLETLAPNNKLLLSNNHSNDRENVTRDSISSGTNLDNLSKKPFRVTEVIRSKNEKQQLMAHECRDCTQYFEMNGSISLPFGVHSTSHMSGHSHKSESEVSRKKHLQVVSRHRARFTRAPTPPGFWKIGFDEKNTKEELLDFNRKRELEKLTEDEWEMARRKRSVAPFGTRIYGSHSSSYKNRERRG
ncbi:hypothetical protein G9A89_011953 [Geosiphon pyriformis]|nr:hypothetical protein G9A89_011953 [Geosiphon pyriformis]